MLKIIAIAILISLIIIFSFGFYLGIHSPVIISKIVSGPYKIACLDHIGPYKNIYKKIQSSKKILDDQKIETLQSCGIYYDDPKKVLSNNLKSKGGWIIKADLSPDILETISISKQDVVSARVKAHPAVAVIKTYPKLLPWIKKHDYVMNGPCLEIYHDNGIVEVQIPITKYEKENQ